MWSGIPQRWAFLCREGRDQAVGRQRNQELRDIAAEAKWKIPVRHRRISIHHAQLVHIITLVSVYCRIGFLNNAKDHCSIELEQESRQVGYSLGH